MTSRRLLTVLVLGTVVALMLALAGVASAQTAPVDNPPPGGDGGGDPVDNPLPGGDGGVDPNPQPAPPPGDGGGGGNPSPPVDPPGDGGDNPNPGSNGGNGGTGDGDDGNGGKGGNGGGGAGDEFRPRVAMTLGGIEVIQEFGQESESGDVSLEFSVSGAGDNSNQCVPALQFANTGSLQNLQGFLQFDSVADDVEFSGGSFVFAPEQAVSCDQTVR